MMRCILLTALVLLLPHSAVAIATPVRPTKNLRITKLARPSPNTNDPPFPTWPKPLVEAHGDYRDEAYLEDCIGGPLYSKQNDLPRLPVPTLEETVNRFLPTALPLARNEQEKQSLLDACRKFPEQARVLQDRLLQQKAEFRDSSWLQQLWNTGYLSCRDPVALLVSYFMFLPNDKTLLEKDLTVPKGIARAAAMLVAMAQSRKLVCSGNMSFETIAHCGQEEPMCSSFFKYMFHSCRIPHESKDYYHLYDPSLHQHCIVACRGHFFALDFVDNQGDPLPLQVLQDRLQYCADLARQQQGKPEMGWLTSLRRDTWANARHELLQVGGKRMREALSKLESGAFVLNLDDQEPESMTEAARLFWHGGDRNGGNRWFDKPLQLVCTTDGQVAYVGEHSMLDAAPALSIIRRILTTTYKRLNKKQPASSPSPHAGVSDIFEDCWSSEPVRATAQRLTRIAREHHKQLSNDYDIQVQEFTGYGKKFIKNASFICHDYVQMAMQLASYRLFGEQVATYEASLTRNFLHGRTETTRTVSPESQAFVECMVSNPSLNHKKKLELFKKATDAHGEYLRKASKGLGVDRHFLGLSSMQKKGEEEPSLFSHPVFLRSKQWRLSTSTVTFAPGFGPVQEDGLGVGYHVDSNSCLFVCTSRKENNYLNRFCKLLDEALEEIGDLVKEESFGQ